MPTLIQKHRKTTAESSLKKVYSMMNQAVTLSEASNGDSSGWTFASGDSPEEIKNFYNKYFKDYLKATDDGSLILPLGEHWRIPAYRVKLSDGSGLGIGYLGHDWFYCFKSKNLQNFSDYHGTDCFRFAFYPDRKPTGTYASIQRSRKKFEPFIPARRTIDGVILKDEDGNELLTTENDLYEQHCYAKKIQLNGWKIPEDYPLKF